MSMVDVFGVSKKPIPEYPPPRPPPSTPVDPQYALQERDMVDTGIEGDENTADDRIPTPVPRQEHNPKAEPRRQHPPSFITSLQLRMMLVNTGSVARDHLSSERTFLAYIRTSLAIASTGVALVQLFSISASTTQGITVISRARGIQAYARPLGATLVLLSLIVLVIGVARYFTIQIALTQGKFPVARTVVMGIAIILSVLVIITFVVLVSVKRSP